MHLIDCYLDVKYEEKHKEKKSRMGKTARKIAISITKGGAGKTTTAVNLAAGLASAGKKVLLVDTDTQSHVSRLLNLSNKYGLYHLVMGEAEVESCIVKARENFWILPGGLKLARLKQEIARRDISPELTLAEALEPLEAGYDYIIIDAAPAWDNLTINVYFYIDELMVPINVEPLTLASLSDFIEESLAPIQKRRRVNPISWRYALPTFMDLRVAKSQEVLEQILDFFSQPEYQETISCEPIRYNARLAELVNHGQTIFEYAPSSKGAEDYQKLTRRVLEDEQR